MTRPPKHELDGADAGLTLIEMIIALAVAMLVVVFLAQGTGLVRQFSLVSHRLSAQDEVLAVRDHLRRQVESAMREQGSLRPNSFAGVGDTVVFTAPGDRLLETGGPIRVTLTAVAERDGVTLAETRSSPSIDKSSRTDRLITGAKQISFSYYGSVGSGAAVWTTEWTDPEASPTLLRVDLAFQTGDPRRWPPLLVLMPSGGTPKSDATAPAPDPGAAVRKPL